MPNPGTSVESEGEVIGLAEHLLVRGPKTIGKED
jgi:hypothetical protein